MTALSGPVMRVVLYEGQGAEPLDGEVRRKLLPALLEKGCAVSCVRDSEPVNAAENGALMVLGRFAGRPPVQAEKGVRFQDVTGMSADEALASLETLRSETALPSPGAWKPWFPVIDYGRCTNCMQCLSFCLFDVYSVSADGKIQVRNQSNCKTDCPACSRVCPEVAIMFPKYRHGPINGEEVSSDDVRREAMKVDISALLGGDIYAALRDRSAKAKSRFSKERDDDRALQERQNCLLKLQKDLDIPPEVLAALPSVEEIRAKAEAARARAQSVTR
jgi:Pyruvate/2-oxoacid:ferredoxin oxidoreductase delta subunit